MRAREFVAEQNAAGPVRAYHGTFQPTIERFAPLSHFGTQAAAEERLRFKGKREGRKQPGRIYQVTLDIRRPFRVKDFAGIHSPTHFAFDLRQAGLIDQEEMLAITRLAGEAGQSRALIQKLQDLGFDGMVYRNKYEDPGSESYVITDPSQVVSVTPINENFANTEIKEGLFDANPATYDLPRRALNVPELIKRGAIFIVDPHGEQGWEPEEEGFSLVTLWNVMRGGWPAEAKQHLRPDMYPVAAKMLNQQGQGTMLYDGKYRQILWSIKKLGIPEEVAFLDVKENFADGKVKGKSRPGRVKRAGASCKGSVTDLRARAKKYGGERGRMYHWCANMKSGRRKSK